jgi:3,4-dihydroxyphenylacetate 2,3-dioxygenase
MGQLVLAAKVTHVPSLMLSEKPGSHLRSAREAAVDSLRELGRRAKARGVTTFVVFDTHWLSNFGYHITPTRGIAPRSPATRRRI